MVEVGRHLEIMWSKPMLKQDHLNLVAEDHVQLCFKYLQGWRFCNLFEQRVLMFDHL